MGVVDHIGAHGTQQQALEAAEAPAPDHEKIDFVGQIDQPPTRMTVVRHPLDPRKRTIQSSGHGVDDLGNEPVSLRPDRSKLQDRYYIRSGPSKQLPDIDRSDEIILRSVLDRPPQRVTRRIRTIHPDSNPLHHRSIAEESAWSSTWILAITRLVILR